MKYLDGKGANAYGFINPACYSNYFVFGQVIARLIAVFALFGILLKKQNSISKAALKKRELTR